MVPSSTAAVEVRGLVKRYGATTAVDGLDLTVACGTILALLGPNGAGKTTTVEACEGFRRPDRGSVRVLGLDPYAGAREHAALTPRIGVMLQRTGVYPAARVREVLRLQAAFAARPLDADDLLDLVGLGHAAGRTFRTLSGGEQQRLCLALALVGRPELVFLDEPTAGLDPQARHGVWDLLRDLRRDGVTVLLTTHLLDEAEALADTVVIVDHGRVVTSGTPAELTRSGASGEVRFHAPVGLPVESLRAALPPSATVRAHADGRYVVGGGVDAQVLAAVTAWCAGNGVMPEDLMVERRSLEDVFLEATGREMRP